MKLCLVLLAIIGLTYGAPKPKDVSPLQQDFDDFFALIPLDQIESIILDAIINDPEVQEVVYYIMSAEFHAVWCDFLAQQGTIDLVNYLTDKGVDVISIIDNINIIQNCALPPWNRKEIHHIHKIKPYTLREVYEKIKALIPVDEIVALWHDKLANSPSWKELIDFIASDSSHAQLHDLVNLPSVQGFLAKLTGWGVDIDKIAAVICKALGWDSI